MALKNALILFFIIPLFLTGCLDLRASEQIPVPSTLLIADDLEAQYSIMLAFSQAYPNEITDIEFFDDDWTMLVNGERFFYANGRFLPERLREQWENFLPYDFYVYPFAGTEAQRRIFINNPVYSVGSSFLFDALHNSPTENDSWDLQEKYSFFGVKMLVHYKIVSKLDIISARIGAAAVFDNSINLWIEELHTGMPSFGWTWRVIAGTNRRSNHSYGTAIDLLPRDLRGRQTYWRWNESGGSARSSAFNIDNFYLPPRTVIEIFEEYGFIWGGNWALIDTMHFEYRPEILILNGFDVKMESADCVLNDTD